MACEQAVRPPHTPCKEIWIPESGNFLLVESRIRNPESGNVLLVEFRILGLGNRNAAQGIRNPTNDCNPESKFHWQRLESSTWKPESTA